MKRCRILSSSARGLPVALLAMGLAAQAAPARAAETAGAGDSREVFSSTAPAWLRAVGQLQVPGSTYHEGRRSHLLEDCSATLVTRGAGRKADTVVTAWHCLVNYDDLSKPITFTLLNAFSCLIEIFLVM